MSTRRRFLTKAVKCTTATSLALLNFSCKNDNTTTSEPHSKSLLSQVGPLQSPDKNGVMLPPGFKSKIIAHSRYYTHANSSYLWHDAPDGGATFGTPDGGWIYVSNSERKDNFAGVGAIQFSKNGDIIDSYSILEGTHRNCAGGATPWDTWLSCEEYDLGKVWECDPFGNKTAIQKPSLGSFAHEAVAVDTDTNYLYMTEDKTDGGLYRFIPYSNNAKGNPDWEQGMLQIAEVNNDSHTITWREVPSPSAEISPTRYQINTSTTFNGGEGIVYFDRIVSFATKGDNKIWSYNTLTNKLSVIYDANNHSTPILKGVDNITLSKEGELVVGEDGDNLQIVAITNTNELKPLIQLIGHDKSEVTGSAFSPDGKRLYFSSQRGTTGELTDGITFEVSGPFHS